MPYPNPTTAWKYAKTALKIAEWTLPAAINWLENELSDSGTSAEADVAWYHWQIVGTRTSPVGTSEDKAIFGLNIVNITAGALDSTWTAGDFTNVDAALDTYIAALAPYTTPNFTFTQYRAYRRQFNPVADPAQPFTSSGPPEFVANVSQAGTGTTVLPDQVACAVTLKTAWPGHWGRFYLPSPDGARVDTYGRLNSAYRTAVANATDALITSLAASDFLLVVPVTQLNKNVFHWLLNVASIQVDDIPDVIRRRRGK